MYLYCKVLKFANFIQFPWSKSKMFTQNIRFFERPKKQVLKKLFFSRKQSFMWCLAFRTIYLHDMYVFILFTYM